MSAAPTPFHRPGALRVAETIVRRRLSATPTIIARLKKECEAVHVLIMNDNSVEDDLVLNRRLKDILRQLRDIAIVQVKTIDDKITDELKAWLLANPPKENQKAAVEELLEAFKSGCHQMVMAAFTQVGKTGACIYVAIQMVLNGTIDPKHVYFITGMSNNEWRKQTKLRVPECWKSNVHHNRGLTVKDFNKNFPETLNKALIIVDECHLATNLRTTMDKMFTHFKLTTHIDSLKDTNSYILYVSATPGKIHYDLETWGIRAGIVRLAAGPGYVGLNELLATNCIRDSKEIGGLKRDEDVETYIQFIEDRWDEPKYHIVRVRTNAKMEERVTRIAGNAGYTVSSHNSVSRIKDFEKQMLTRPSVHTIFIIKGFLTASKTLWENSTMDNPKNKYYGSSVEYAGTKPDTSVICQGILGRNTGYNLYNEEYDGPVHFAPLKAVYEYMGLANQGYKYANDIPYTSRTFTLVDGKKKESNIGSIADPSRVDGLEGDIHPIYTTDDVDADSDTYTDSDDDYIDDIEPSEMDVVTWHPLIKFRIEPGEFCNAAGVPHTNARLGERLCEKYRQIIHGICGADFDFPTKVFIRGNHARTDFANESIRKSWSKVKKIYDIACTQPVDVRDWKESCGPCGGLDKNKETGEINADCMYIDIVKTDYRLDDGTVIPAGTAFFHIIKSITYSYE